MGERKEKEEFESPLSRFIRMYCSQCKDYPDRCNMSYPGLLRMNFCVLTLRLLGDAPSK